MKPEIVFTGAGGLTVGDWVEVTHDFSPGHNSGGGVGVITEVVGNLCHVRYIVDGHAEKLIPITRMTYDNDSNAFSSRKSAIANAIIANNNRYNDRYVFYRINKNE